MQQVHFKYKDTNRLEVKIWEKVYANTNQNKVRVSTYINIRESKLEARE